MSALVAIVEALVDAGATPEMILAAVKANEAANESAIESRRRKDADRQARRRAKVECHVTSRDDTVTERDPSPSEVFPHTPYPNNPNQVPPYSPPKTRRSKPAEPGGGEVEAVAEKVWVSASQTARDRSSRKENRKAVAAALASGATPEALTASVGRLCAAKGEFANGVHILVNGEHWRDELPAATADEPDPWSFRLGLWGRDRTWREDWGPPPDRPGCRAPPDLIQPPQAA